MRKGERGSVSSRTAEQYLKRRERCVTEQSATRVGRGRQPTKMVRKRRKPDEQGRERLEQFLKGKTRTLSSEETGGLDQPDGCQEGPFLNRQSVQAEEPGDGVSSDRQKESDTIASQTAALVEYAKAQGYAVPAEWIFQDEGYSGASLVRPGLEALRDLAAQGQITTVLIYSPDRLSRKYAYQVLLGEELSRCGVEVVFLKSPAGSSPEDQLVVQFQGMIAEYERAQIAERSRRGKRYKAQQGVVNVLSGAPYGYQYMRKT